MCIVMEPCRNCGDVEQVRHSHFGEWGVQVVCDGCLDYDSANGTIGYDVGANWKHRVVLAYAAWVESNSDD